MDHTHSEMMNIVNLQVAPARSSPASYFNSYVVSNADYFRALRIMQVLGYRELPKTGNQARRFCLDGGN